MRRVIRNQITFSRRLIICSFDFGGGSGPFLLAGIDTQADYTFIRGHNHLFI